MTNLYEDILVTSRQDQTTSLTPFFEKILKHYINMGVFMSEERLKDVADDIVAGLKQYSKDHNINTVAIGISGGVDSALTAKLFQLAGWKVVPVVMPIHQNSEETARGIAACKAMNLEDYWVLDLSDTFDKTANTLFDLMGNQFADTERNTKIRQGNIRARLRMITLYNAAHLNKGLVASTDNFSELAAGFWTLNGDVGDLSPIQSLLKSWEVPKMAELLGFDTEIARAKPTDGLGIDDGDEAQFGCSYLEWDLMVLTMFDAKDDISLLDDFGDDKRAKQVYDLVCTRVKNSAFKRKGTVYIEPKRTKHRYGAIERLDSKLQKGE